MSMSLVPKIRKLVTSRRHFLLLRRSLNQDLTTALRPFYFAVHPDFFAQHPEQRNTNENSLKLLSEHLEALYERRQRSGDTQVLKFYVRTSSDADKRDSFKLIQIRTDWQSTRDPKTFIQGLLESCNLSTEYVKNIKAQPEQPKGFSGLDFKPGQDYHYDAEFAEFESQLKNERAFNRPVLSTWLEENAGTAKQRSKETADLQAEIDKLQKVLVEKLELQDARYECGWNIEHYRGCLKTLERLANTHLVEMAPLKRRIVVFAPFTGISLEGHVMLFTGDVLNTWIDFIKNIPHHDAYLKVVPVYERTLAQVLLEIQIGRRKFMPKQQARGYASYLMKVTTSLNDYLGKQKYPAEWPKTLKEFTIVVESEAGPLMVSPTGQFITPATCPGSILVDFISVNMELARERMKKYAQDKHVEQELMDSCIKQLQLQSLTKDDAVTPDKMITALKDLSQLQVVELQGCKLHITHYYSVLTDGVVCIPWDFQQR
ncbi:T-cell activation inhibitor, mitochondrial isoform X2 [Drosophila subpulchrella]|uniref:T-cell activation inhibitor, mitochondrial isoform X2 n=1 Tax=Drosophila subpulchrella TaxID=1486046 RepID=UPI0018A1B387|nr:T-cell activation inhibitor, mitochondrial isoform X2 [Drosophila subpulchrella]